MTTQHQVKHVSPILPVADMEQALDFYTNVLLFDVLMKSADYSIVVKDHGSLHLRQIEGSTEDVRATEIYIEVTGIDALWEHVKSYKGQYKIRDPFVQEYSMKEFHIIAPNHCLIFVGQRVG